MLCLKPARQLLSTDAGKRLIQVTSFGTIGGEHRCGNRGGCHAEIIACDYRRRVFGFSSYEQRRAERGLCVWRYTLHAELVVLPPDPNRLLEVELAAISLERLLPRLRPAQGLHVLPAFTGGLAHKGLIIGRAERARV